METTKTVETMVTKANLNEVFERIIVGNISAQNYNSNCFGMSDLKRANKMEYAVDQFITKVIEAGYCQHAILGETLEKYGYHLKSEVNPALKTIVDDDFSLDMSSIGYAIEFGYNVFDDTVDSINKGYLKYR